MKRLVAIVMTALFACSGTQLPPPSNPTSNAWVSGAFTAISVAQSSIPALETIINARTDIPDTAKTSIHNALQAAGDSLGLAVSALHAYEAAPTIDRKCRVHFYLAEAITGALHGVQIARDVTAGMNINPFVFAGIAAALGGIAFISDMIYPGCAASGSPGPAAQRQTDTQRVQAAFAL